MKTTVYRVGINLTEYRKRMHQSIIMSAGITFGVMLIVMICAVLLTVQAYSSRLTTLEAEHAAQLAAVDEEYQNQIDYLNYAHKTEADGYQTVIDELSEYTNQRVADSQELFEYARKYYYVFRDAPDNSGLTMDDIVYLDDLCKEENLNPHLMWCIYDNESGYITTIDNYSGSSARGLGQVLASTGKSIYENILQLGSYDHSMAYDSKINMQLTVELISRNIGSGLYNAIALYSGDSSGAYYNKLLQTAREHGVDIQSTGYQ